MTSGPFVDSPSYWDLERIYDEVFEVPIGDHHGYITVDAEVPRTKAGERLPREGNRWYPTLITVEGPGDMWLHASSARELGQKLIAAADAADVIDKHDEAPCGHWKPCDCESNYSPTDKGGSSDA